MIKKTFLIVALGLLSYSAVYADSFTVACGHESAQDGVFLKVADNHVKEIKFIVPWHSESSTLLPFDDGQSYSVTLSGMDCPFEQPFLFFCASGSHHVTVEGLGGKKDVHEFDRVVNGQLYSVRRQELGIGGKTTEATVFNVNLISAEMSLTKVYTFDASATGNAGCSVRP